MAASPTKRPPGRIAAPSTGQSRIAPTAAKALRVIELLATDPPNAMSLAEMQRQLGYSHGNLHAICTTLVAMGHVRREPGERGYRLGPALLAIGDAARAALPSVDAAMAFLQTLAAEFDTETHAAMRSGDSIVVVARVGRLADYGVHVGQRLPFTPPIGSTFAAWATNEERDAYLGSAAGVLGKRELGRIQRALDAVHDRGYSIHLDVEPSRKVRETSARQMRDATLDEADDELRALVHELGRHNYSVADAADIKAGTFVQLSAPAFDDRGNVELSVGMSLCASTSGERAVRAPAERVVATARMITKAIGGVTPA